MIEWLDGKRRARAVNGTTTTRYRWGLGWDLLNEENGGGTLTNMYIGHLAEVPGSNPATGAWGRENGGQSRLRSFVASLGTVPGFRSTRALFDQSKAQVAGYEYTPYGELYASSGTASTTHMFTGHDWDATAGHYFAPYRYYRPDLARWLSPDPAGFVDGLNVYGYVRGNPAMRLDPRGLTVIYRVPGPFPNGREIIQKFDPEYEFPCECDLPRADPEGAACFGCCLQIAEDLIFWEEGRRAIQACCLEECHGLPGRSGPGVLIHCLTLELSKEE